MNKTQYLLTKLAEEASELAVDALKAAQFGAGEVYEDVTNADRLQLELYDLLTVLKLLEEEGLVLVSELPTDYETYKRKKILHYYNYAKTLGTVNGN
jgi:hypothetical protein